MSRVTAIDKSEGSRWAQGTRTWVATTGGLGCVLNTLRHSWTVLTVTQANFCFEVSVAAFVGLIQRASGQDGSRRRANPGNVCSVYMRGWEKMGFRALWEYASIELWS